MIVIDIDILNFLEIIVVPIGILVTMVLSGFIVEYLVQAIKRVKKAEPENQSKPLLNIGTIIGKCENFIIIVFILSNEITALAIIFTAKSIVRAEDIKKDPEYYLAGSIINFTFSLLMAYIIKYTQSLILSNHTIIPIN